MSSPAQLEANRANARLSTGPKTEAGKSRARLNGYRHGLTGQVCIFTPQDQAAFESHCSGIREALAPSGALELDLAQSIAEDRWRLKRARALECGIFALGQAGETDETSVNHPEITDALAQARTWLAEGKNLQLLTLYEQRIHRSVEKSMAQLAALQTQRREARQKALEEAQLLAQLAYMRDQPYDPAPDFPPEASEFGSEFSTGVINALIGRNQRLREARYYEFSRWNVNDKYTRPEVRIPKAA
jgi:hypothetical protein